MATDYRASALRPYFDLVAKFSGSKGKTEPEIPSTTPKDGRLRQSEKGHAFRSSLGKALCDLLSAGTRDNHWLMG